jgi:hypothetical protein
MFAVPVPGMLSWFAVPSRSVKSIGCVCPPVVQLGVDGAVYECRLLFGSSAGGAGGPPSLKCSSPLAGGYDVVDGFP